MCIIYSKILGNSVLVTWKGKSDRLLVAQLVEEFCGPLWNLNVHYHVYKNLLLEYILSQINPVHNFTRYWALSPNCENRLSAPSYMSVHLCVRPHGITRLKLNGFSWNLVIEYFSKFVENIQDSLKSDKNNGYLTGRQTYILIISRSVLLRMRSVSEKTVAKTKKHKF